jgi:biotin carboxyl carrier protein
MTMTRILTFAALLGTLGISSTLTAQTPTRMALPTGGLNPPMMSAPQPAKSSVQPVTSGAVKAVATPGAPAALPVIKSETPAAKPAPVAAQPAVATATKTSGTNPTAPVAISPGTQEPAVLPRTGTSTPAVPVVVPAVAAQVPPESTPVTLVSPATSSAAATPALEQPEWRYAQKPELPRTTTRDYRTAMMQPEARSPNRIRDCLLKASAEVQLPAQEAGVLVDLQAFEGQEVKQNQILGRVDDSQPRLQKKAAEAEKAVTFEKSKSTIKERFAAKASDVARKEWEKAVESNNNAPGSVSQVEVMRLQLTWEKGKLEIEQAQEDRKVDALSVMAKDVDVEAADDAIRRRHLIAPIPGTIVELTPHIGEWLKPGDPVLKIVNLEILKIEGYVNIDHFRQDQLRNQVVTALVDLGNKQQVEVQARITFVSPVVEPGGEYRIKAEIQNRKNQAGEWELKPGLNAELILKSTAPASAPRLP